MNFYSRSKGVQMIHLISAHHSWTPSVPCLQNSFFFFSQVEPNSTVDLLHHSCAWVHIYLTDVLIFVNMKLRSCLQLVMRLNITWHFDTVNIKTHLRKQELRYSHHKVHWVVVLTHSTLLHRMIFISTWILPCYMLKHLKVVLYFSILHHQCWRRGWWCRYT